MRNAKRLTQNAEMLNTKRLTQNDLCVKRSALSIYRLNNPFRR